MSWCNYISWKTKSGEIKFHLSWGNFELPSGGGMKARFTWMKQRGMHSLSNSVSVLDVIESNKVEKIKET